MTFEVFFQPKWFYDLKTLQQTNKIQQQLRNTAVITSAVGSFSAALMKSDWPWLKLVHEMTKAAPKSQTPQVP